MGGLPGLEGKIFFLKILRQNVDSNSPLAGVPVGGGRLHLQAALHMYRPDLTVEQEMAIREAAAGSCTVFGLYEILINYTLKMYYSPPLIRYC